MKIGITARSIVVNDKESFVLYKRYINYFQGHEIVFILPNQSPEILDLCNCFILSGGDDLNPKLYNDINTNSDGIDDEMDSLDFMVIHHAYTNGKKILGICRGIQSINVYFGGSLTQNVLNHMNTFHNIKKINNSKTLDLCNVLSVNSYHHQIIKKIGVGLNVLYTSDDNVVEILEHVNGKIIGVQFHPEIEIDINSKQIFDFIIS